ncbi:pyruvate dehydrogenase complex dihydrolipoyllysine-residue acetyltransferase [Marinobacter sp. JSM 1782161]|uniref:pyruvate dehydrogenase complex dihydrolipoyllysine-residue acetyltransferase n=1 Tax=Marinobacter sp. JSM 1782161 TaxID=2685906 RepID=UPI001A9D6C4C|nr:pyruvate dehydrogenase complex dihydrolipoyllysine-residue acetyltransferase [Marinobacter sp. JSM 1782161]
MAEDIRVPDLGGSESVEVIEISVKVGDTVAEEDPILVLESDKASVELPAPKGGKITALNVSVGDSLSEGDVVGQIEAGEGESADSAAEEDAPAKAEAEPAPAQEEAPAQSSGGGVEDIVVPDLGGADSVEVIEISAKVGDSLEAEDAILVVESDKASVELPAPAGGTLKALSVSVGDSISEGDVIGQIETAGGSAPAAAESAPAAEKPAEAPAASAPAASGGGSEDIVVPDLGGADSVEVIEISVAAGDDVAEEDPILVVESDKASVELPAPAAGKVKAISVSVGDRISEGDVVGQIETSGGAAAPAPAAQPESRPAAPAKSESAPASQPTAAAEPAAKSGKKVHAGPAVRRLARELGADLGRIQGSGPKNRILKEDVEKYIKQALAKVQQDASPAGAGLPAVKLPDFSQFGEIERQSMSRLMKLTADSMQRSWLNVPHVTQFEEADITEMEDFRKSKKAEGEKRGVKLTPMAFLLKICAKALAEHPNFNVSLDMEKKEVIQKRYIHIGIAVDTPDGLVVPVIRNVDQKGLWELAEECQVMAQKARDKKLGPKDMQGACFTITSLGGIGGTAFTPIVNTPEVAILGVSKSKMAPVWDGSAFQPRLMLPLSLSYDHRAINGADAARFTNTLRAGLEDLRHLLL